MVQENDGINVKRQRKKCVVEAKTTAKYAENDKDNEIQTILLEISKSSITFTKRPQGI